MMFLSIWHNYHISINKLPSNADYFALNEKIETNSVLNLKRIIEPELENTKIFLWNVALKIASEKDLLLILSLKLILGVKILNI